MTALLLVLGIVVVECARTNLSPYGDNVCLKTETYEKPVVITRHLPRPKTETKWCWDPKQNFRCTVTNMVMKEIKEEKVIKRTRLILGCCEGYKINPDDSTQCIHDCSSGCVNGECIGPNTCACDSGFYGHLCDKPCPVGRWGRNCSETCDCINNAQCERVFGNCLCEDGWYGYRCELACPDGYFGRKCLNECECRDDPCHHITGVCLKEPEDSDFELKNHTDSVSEVNDKTKQEGKVGLEIPPAKEIFVKNNVTENGTANRIIMQTISTTQSTKEEETSKLQLKEAVTARQPQPTEDVLNIKQQPSKTVTQAVLGSETITEDRKNVVTEITLLTSKLTEAEPSEKIKIIAEPTVETRSTSEKTNTEVITDLLQTENIAVVQLGKTVDEETTGVFSTEALITTQQTQEVEEEKQETTGFSSYSYITASSVQTVSYESTQSIENFKRIQGITPQTTPFMEKTFPHVKIIVKSTTESTDSDPDSNETSENPDKATVLSKSTANPVSFYFTPISTTSNTITTNQYKHTTNLKTTENQHNRSKVTDNFSTESHHKESIIEKTNYSERLKSNLDFTAKKDLTNDGKIKSNKTNYGGGGANDENDSLSYNFNAFRFIPSLSVLSGISILIILIGVRWLLLSHRRKVKKLSQRKKEELLGMKEREKFQESLFMGLCSKEKVELKSSEENLQKPQIDLKEEKEKAMKKI